MSVDFELCSYSDAFNIGTLNGAAMKCENYGAFFCRICKRYWCNDHRCSHLLTYSSDDSSRCVQEFGDSEPDEDENGTDIDISVGLCYIATHLLRDRRDRLFSALKKVQHELDLREGSAGAIARDLSTTNLDKWLGDQGYDRRYQKDKGRSINNGASGRSNRRGVSNISGRSNNDPKNREKKAQQSIETLFAGMSEEQIKIFTKHFRGKV